ncbi:MAG: tandem-95 repeat protein, partial [Mariprofundus sp.]|nr:tandem-95 repeat protein [Mariprofundus sp.]
MNICVRILLILSCLMISACGQGGGDATGSVASSNISVAGTTAVTISINTQSSRVAGGALAPGAVQSASVEAFDANGISVAGPVSANVPNLTITLNVPNGSGIVFVVQAYASFGGATGGGALLFEGRSPPQTLGGAPIVLPIQMNLKIVATASALSVQPGVIVNLAGTVSGSVPPTSSPLLWTATGGVLGIAGINGATNSWTAPAVAGSYTITANIDPAINTTHNPAIVAAVNISVDQTAPVITLAGTNPTILNVGTAYTESGATAVDNIDGNLSASIVVTGQVNSTVVGANTITYQVSDAAGNAAMPVTRSVNVVDTVAPLITTPAPVTIVATSVNGISAQNGTIQTFLAGATATDNVGVLSLTNNAPQLFPIGVNNVVFTAIDAAGNTVSATSSVTVTAPTNQPPLPTAVAITTAMNTAASSQVTANDPNAGDTHTYAVSTPPVSGTAVVSGSGMVSYTPNTAFSGTDSLAITVTDQGGLTGSVTIAITVNAAANQAPVAVNDTGSTAEDTAFTTINVLLNDTDANNDVLSVIAADTLSVLGGTVVNNGNGTFTYTPLLNFNGTDTFTYTASDGITSAVGTVTITVTAVNDAPVFTGTPSVVQTAPVQGTILTLTGVTTSDVD